MLFTLCRRAERRGLLLGDLNDVRGVALDVVMSLERFERKEENRKNQEFWLMFAHPEQYEHNQRMWEHKKQQERDDVSLSAGSMMELISLIKESEDG